MTDKQPERGLLTSAWFYYGLFASLSVWAAIYLILREATR